MSALLRFFVSGVLLFVRSLMFLSVTLLGCVVLRAHQLYDKEASRNHE